MKPRRTASVTRATPSGPSIQTAVPAVFASRGCMEQHPKALGIDKSCAIRVMRDDLPMR